MINKNIKDFEQQLLSAINAYLYQKKFLQNGKGIKYYCANPAVSGLGLNFSAKEQENILLAFWDCPTNARPCLSGYMDLRLKRDGGINFSSPRFYFHICTCDYVVLSSNPLKIKVKNITILLKQGSRWY